VGEVPDEIFPYLLATRYCESDVLCGEVVTHVRQPAVRLQRVRRSRNGSATTSYRPGSTNSNSTAHEVLEQRPASAATSRTWASPSAAR
jgi:hypothetical protein